MSMKLIEVQARMISLRERILREGNPVSNDLPEVVDQMLQDLAQSTGAFSYNDIIQFSKIATPQSIATLRRYAKKFNSIADDNGEPDEEDIKEVSKIVRQGVTDYRGLIHYILDLKKVENDGASHVSYGKGEYAFFWYDENEGCYKLVLNEGSTPEETKYWGDEELIEVNDIRLTDSQLYKELLSLPNADLKNWYGLNNVFTKFGRDRYMDL